MEQAEEDFDAFDQSLSVSVPGMNSESGTKRNAGGGKEIRSKAD